MFSLFLSVVSRILPLFKSSVTQQNTLTKRILLLIGITYLCVFNTAIADLKVPQLTGLSEIDGQSLYANLMACDGDGDGSPAYCTPLSSEQIGSCNGNSCSSLFFKTFYLTAVVWTLHASSSNININENITKYAFIHSPEIGKAFSNNTNAVSCPNGVLEAIDDNTVSIKLARGTSCQFFAVWGAQSYWGANGFDSTISFSGATLSLSNEGVYSLDGNGVLKGAWAGGTADTPPPAPTAKGVTISPLFVPIKAQTSQVTPTTFTVKNEGNEIIYLANPEAITASSLEFAISDSTCDSLDTLAPEEACSFKVKYTHDSNVHNTNANPNSLGVISVEASENGTLASALITSTETDADEAERRLPPVIDTLTIPALVAGTTSEIQWSTIDYQSGTSYSEIAIFECQQSPAEADCGKDIATKTAGEIVAQASEVASGWEFQSSKAKKKSYSYKYTPTPNTTAGKEVVIRFFQKSDKDYAANNIGISLLIPGGLKNSDKSGSGPEIKYHDQVGRRIAVTISGASGQ